jgi:hypothetical protein
MTVFGIDNPLAWLKERAAKDNLLHVRRAALYVLARSWKDDPDTLSWLKERAVNDDKPLERLNALDAIFGQWPEHPETLSLLYELAQNDPEPDLRELIGGMANLIEERRKSDLSDA